MEQPEFSEDAAKLKEVLSVIDNPDKLRQLLQDEAAAASEEGVDVRIQDEGDLAIVSAEIAVPGANNATLSLVGPSRMDYGKAMDLLKLVCEMIGDYFGGRTPPSGSSGEGGNSA